jgi:hypothetical protein
MKIAPERSYGPRTGNENPNSVEPQLPAEAYRFLVKTDTAAQIYVKDFNIKCYDNQLSGS